MITRVRTLPVNARTGLIIVKSPQPSIVWTLIPKECSKGIWFNNDWQPQEARVAWLRLVLTRSNQVLTGPISCKVQLAAVNCTFPLAIHTVTMIRSERWQWEGHYLRRTRQNLRVPEITAAPQYKEPNSIDALNGAFCFDGEEILPGIRPLSCRGAGIINPGLSKKKASWSLRVDLNIYLQRRLRRSPLYVLRALKSTTLHGPIEMGPSLLPRARASCCLRFASPETLIPTPAG